jgi:hypothetical protein
MAELSEAAGLSRRRQNRGEHRGEQFFSRLSSGASPQFSLPQSDPMFSLITARILIADRTPPRAASDLSFEVMIQNSQHLLYTYFRPLSCGWHTTFFADTERTRLGRTPALRKDYRAESAHVASEATP